MSDDEGNAAFEAEQAKRLAREKRIEEAEAKAKKEQRHAELEAAKREANDPDREQAVREEVAKLREAAQKKKREQKNGVDSDDDEAKEDEAMEGDESDHDDENSDPPLGQSDPDDSDSSSAIARQKAIEKHEKKERYKLARKFVEDTAAMSDDETEEAKKLLKDLKKKHDKKASLHDAESEREETASDRGFIEDDDAVRYDTDFEEELKAKTKKKEKGSPKKAKRKRIASSDEEGSADEAQEEEKKESKPEKPEKKAVFDTDDEAIENMVAMEQENAANRKSAKFHEHGDIAKSTADKKNKPIDPESIMDSPKKTKATTKPKNSPANGGKKKAAAKGRDKPTFQVGDEFESGKSAYVVTHRADDFPMVRGNSGFKFDDMCPDITRLSTCEKVETLEDGTYKHTGVFELFFISKETSKLKKLVQNAAQQGMWEAFLAKYPEQAKKLVLQACLCDNLYEKKRLLLPPSVWKKIFKDCHKLNGEFRWEPKKPKTAAAEPLPPVAPTMTPQASFSSRVEKVATPPGSGKQPKAPSTPKSNSNKSAAAKKQKTTHSNENGTHDIAQMLQRSKAPPAATTAAAAMEDDIFASIFAPVKKMDMFESGRASMSKLLAESLRALLHANPKSDELKKAYADIGLQTTELSKKDLSPREKVALLQSMMGYEIGKEVHPLFALMYFLPWVSEEAAVVAREVVFGR